MNRKSLWLTLGIVGVGIALGLAIVFSDGIRGTHDGEHAHGDARHDEGKGAGPKAPKSGPGSRGGRVLTSGAFALEVTIFERGVPPEFRVWAYENGKVVTPAEMKLTVELERLAAPPEAIGFRAQDDFLKSDREIAEPHSFSVRVSVQYQGKAHRWQYEQVEGRIKMDAETAKRTGIDIAAAGPAKIESTLQLQGEIQLNQDRVAHVVPRLAGVVVASPRNIGDNVKKGDLLAVIESQALAELKGVWLAAQKRLELAQITYEREKRLWEEKISAEQDFIASRYALNEAQIAQQTALQRLVAIGASPGDASRGGRDALTRYEIRAPLAGTIVEKHLTLGEAVKEDADIFTIADLSTVWAEMTVYPKDLHTVRVGQKATVTGSASEPSAMGNISYVGALVGEQTRSTKARVTLQNPQRRWAPGLLVNVELVRQEAHVPVAVAVDAIQTYRDWKVVFIRVGDFFEARPVELGRSDGKTVEITKGLAPGTPYAARGSYTLKAELGKAGASHNH